MATLTGKTAVVTGSTSGIGLAIATSLAEAGARIGFNGLGTPEQIKAASLFVAGWRPAIGWVCALALGFQYLLRPLFGWAAGVWWPQLPALPGLDANLWELMFGMLGLGGLRSFERQEDPGDVLRVAGMDIDRDRRGRDPRAVDGGLEILADEVRGLYRA